MHKKLVLALDPSVSPTEAFEAAAEDWVKDSSGKIGLDKEKFCWCWFECACMHRAPLPALRRARR